MEDEGVEGQERQPDEADINLETFECPLREWISEDRTRREIRKRFNIFLKTFYPGIEEVRHENPIILWLDSIA